MTPSRHRLPQGDLAKWAGMAAMLCQSAGWWQLEALLGSLSQQAAAGVRPELLKLMQVGGRARVGRGQAELHERGGWGAGTPAAADLPAVRAPARRQPTSRHPGAQAAPTPPRPPQVPRLAPAQARALYDAGICTPQHLAVALEEDVRAAVAKALPRNGGWRRPP